MPTGTTGWFGPVLLVRDHRYYRRKPPVLLKLQNQRSMSYDFRSKFYPTSEDDVDEVNELPFCLFLHQFVDRAPITYERDKDRERTWRTSNISSNHKQQQQARGTHDLSRGSATPQRSSYVLIVEMTTKVRVSSTSLPPSSNHKG
jgi:hypothetical protein